MVPFKTDLILYFEWIERSIVISIWFHKFSILISNWKWNKLNLIFNIFNFFLFQCDWCDLRRNSTQKNNHCWCRNFRWLSEMHSVNIRIFIRIILCSFWEDERSFILPVENFVLWDRKYCKFSNHEEVSLFEPDVKSEFRLMNTI